MGKSALLVLVLWLASASLSHAEDRGFTKELPKSPYKYGHPALMYLKSSKPIPDAHAACLKYVEHMVDVLYSSSVFHIASIDDDDNTEFRARAEKVIKTDWGVLAHEDYKDIFETAAKSAASQKSEYNRAMEKLKVAKNDIKLNMAGIESLARAKPNVDHFYFFNAQVNQNLASIIRTNHEATLSMMSFTECSMKHHLPATIQ